VFQDGTTYAYDATYTYTGVVVGFNAGLFVEVNPGLAIGGLFSFSVRKPARACLKVDGYVEECRDVDHIDAEKVVGFNGALLF
jgi:hypothetical protein